MSDWLKVLVPIVLTGMGAIIFGLFNDVKRINATQLEGQTWMYRIEQNELKIGKLQTEHDRK